MTTYPKNQLKQVATINDDTLSESTPADYELQYIDIGNVNSLGKINEVATYRFQDAPSRARRVVNDGDIIISTVRTYLQAIAPIEDPPDNLVVSTGFAVVRPIARRLATDYCKYALREPSFIHEVIKNSVGVSYPAINTSELSEILISVPSLGQQSSIADYLDKETDKIDKLINVLERSLDLLAEKRQALITHAVTRGLEPNVPMRDSGVEWIGEIPSHWEVLPLKYICTIGNGSTPLRQEDRYWKDGTIPWLTSTVVNDDTVEMATQFITDTALSECHLPLVAPESVLVAITGQGKTRGKATILKFEATINQHMVYMTPLPTKVSSAFLQSYLSSIYTPLRVMSEGSGSTRGALTVEQLNELFIAAPDLDEQERIVSKIAPKKQTIDKLSMNIENVRKLLIERRISLISAAVTGQLDIPTESCKSKN